MKGRFFQALLPKWQRKLGAPKTDESFDELFSRARTMECREQQYNDIADERKGKDKAKKADSEPNRGKGSDSRSKVPNEDSDSNSRKPISGKSAYRQGQQQHIQCRACGQYGHIARNCSQKRRQGAESPGRQDSGTTAKPKDSLQVHSVADYSNKELEQELTRRKLDKEQQLADEPTKSVNVVTGAVGSAYLLDVSVGGLVVSALVDTGSQSTIMSRAFLHKVFAHMRGLGDTQPRLQEPCTKFKGKGGNPIQITAQVPLTLSVDGKVTSVPVFIQPDSEQDCLLGSNVLPALGISVVRANGHPLIASSKVLGQNETVGVNLVQATTLPGLNGCFAKAKIDMTGLEDACLLFEPDHKALGDSGVSAFESLISVDSNGYAVVPIHNYQGNCVTLKEAPWVWLGDVRHQGVANYQSGMSQTTSMVVEL